MSGRGRGTGTQRGRGRAQRYVRILDVQGKTLGYALYRGLSVETEGRRLLVALYPLEFDVVSLILGMDCLAALRTIIDCNGLK